MEPVPPPLRVLIVEDEALLAMDLEMMVTDSGHAVVGEAASVSEVGRLHDSVAPDLALVDMHLDEGSNGIDACASILARWPGSVVVFVTANEARIPDDFAGAHGVIGKPFSYGGVSLVMKYLARALQNPPPPWAPPSALRLAPMANEAWAAAG